MPKMIVDGMAHILEQDLRPEDVTALQSTLTVEGPDDEFGGGGEPKVIKFYEMHGGTIRVPRQWGVQRFGKKFEIEDRCVDGDPVAVKFRGQWRPGQEAFVEDILKGVREDGRGLGGVGKADPGFGKTVCSAGLIERVGRATLVVVPTKVLLRQWVKRMETYLGITPGIVMQDACDFGEAVTIALVHSLAARDYGDAFRQRFGLVICDEAHHNAAPMWARAVQQFPARLRIGLTATPKRGDGLQRVLLWQIGPIIAHGVGKTLKARVELVEWDEVIERRRFSIGKRGVLGKFISALAEERRYSRWIVREFVYDALDRGRPKDGLIQRQVLILSDRVEHLVMMRDYFDELCQENPPWNKNASFQGSSLCVGEGQKVNGKRFRPDPDDVVAKRAALFATWPLLKEGFDVDTLSVLVQATPRADVEQAVGRIQRLYAGKPEPVVIDPRFPWARWLLYRYEGKRDRFYSERGFEVFE